MEKLVNYKVTRKSSSKFRVAPLWNWTLASVEITDGIHDYNGFAFDRHAITSVNKAESEATERLIYGSWEQTGVSPFSLRTCSAPPPTSGFASHPNKTISANGAFLEWRERAALQMIANGDFSLMLIEPPNLGFLFKPALISMGCDLKVACSSTFPYVAFTLGILREGGVIFGSACRENKSFAVVAAISECIRKLAFTKEWLRASPETNDLVYAAHFWLSHEGSKRAHKYFEAATTSKATSNELPHIPQPSLTQQTQLGNRFVSFYQDRRFDLPEVSSCTVPLL